ncbi:hypothetical protein N9X48_00010 [Luminiphilus sp.]|nr:hypothetical protein [Luminiphilus sp.]MDA8947059.1 hypothetical protein [Luminiphilus sp.]MDB2440521.1 hypothetical protein [Luminiphilus sp.]MDB2511041.1 hypothetical protein [Luminiphilus sp.]
MEFGLLIGAALLSLVGALFHGVAGHRLYMGNINASNLEPLAKTLSLVSWHTFTIMLLVGAGTLACVAYNPTMNLMAYPIILTNAAGALMFLALGLGSHRQLLTLPGLYLMGGTAMLAMLGVG